MSSRRILLVLLSIIFLLSITISFVSCESGERTDPVNAQQASEQAQTSPEERRNYPYGRNTFAQSGSSVSFGENQALAVPSWVLYIILIGFIAVLGYVVNKIFEAQGSKARKEAEKKKLKEERKSKKTSSKKSS